MAIVTVGAGAGIGQAVTRRLAAEHTRVVISDAHAERPLDLASFLVRDESSVISGGVVLL